MFATAAKILQGKIVGASNIYDLPNFLAPVEETSALGKAELIGQLIHFFNELNLEGGGQRLVEHLLLLAIGQNIHLRRHAGFESKAAQKLYAQAVYGADQCIGKFVRLFTEAFAQEFYPHPFLQFSGGFTRKSGSNYSVGTYLPTTEQPHHFLC